MNWAKVGPACIGLACALVIIANAPPVLTDPIVTALNQIRINTAKTEKTAVSAQDPASQPYPEEMPVQKKSR